MVSTEFIKFNQATKFSYSVYSPDWFISLSLFIYVFLSLCFCLHLSFCIFLYLSIPVFHPFSLYEISISTANSLELYTFTIVKEENNFNNFAVRDNKRVHE